MPKLRRRFVAGGWKELSADIWPPTRFRDTAVFRGEKAVGKLPFLA